MGEEICVCGAENCPFENCNAFAVTAKWDVKSINAKPDGESLLASVVSYAQEKTNYMIKYYLDRVEDGEVTRKDVECVKCQETFHSEEELQQHLKLMHYRSRRTRNGVFNRTSFLSKPDKQKIAESKIPTGETGRRKRPCSSYECTKCDKVFQNRKAYDDHVSEDCCHSSVDKFKCSKCERTFVNKYALRYHVTSGSCKALSKQGNKNIKTAIQPQDLSCLTCGKKFKYSAKLKSHIQRKVCQDKNTASEESRKQLSCSECGKKFKFEAKLRYHVNNRICPELQNQYKCSKCNKVFKHEARLRNHLKNRICRITCTHCGKEFITEGKFLSHQKRCGKQATSQHSRKTKRRTSEHVISNLNHEHDPNLEEYFVASIPKEEDTEDFPFQCENCDMLFKTKGKYTSHVNQSTCIVTNADTSAIKADEPSSFSLILPSINELPPKCSDTFVTTVPANNEEKIDANSKPLQANGAGLTFTMNDVTNLKEGVTRSGRLVQRTKIMEELRNAEKMKESKRDERKRQKIRVMTEIPYQTDANSFKVRLSRSKSKHIPRATEKRGRVLSLDEHNSTLTSPSTRIRLKRIKTADPKPAINLAHRGSRSTRKRRNNAIETAEDNVESFRIIYPRKRNNEKRKALRATGDKDGNVKRISRLKLSVLTKTNSVQKFQKMIVKMSIPSKTRSGRISQPSRSFRESSSRELQGIMAKSEKKKTLKSFVNDISTNVTTRSGRTVKRKSFA